MQLRWFKTHYPNAKPPRTGALKEGPVDDDSPIGRLFHHPGCVRIEVHYTTGTSTHWRDRPEGVE